MIWVRIVALQALVRIIIPGARTLSSSDPALSRTFTGANCTLARSRQSACLQYKPLVAQGEDLTVKLVVHFREKLTSTAFVALIFLKHSMDSQNHHDFDAQSGPVEVGDSPKIRRLLNHTKVGTFALIGLFLDTSCV